MSITGNGYFVSDWNVTGYWNGGDICTTSYYWQPYDRLIAMGNTVCGGAGVFYYDWQPDKTFPYGQACNTFSNSIPGKPCEWITA